MNQHLSTAITISGYISLVVGAVFVLMSKVKTDNLNDLKQRVDILEKELQFTRAERDKEKETYRKDLNEEIKTRQEMHLQNQKSISNLEGQLATYKEIPLKSIASSLQALSNLLDSNNQILETLKGSAIIAATDRDALVNSNQTIESQIVEHQTVKGKE